MPENDYWILPGVRTPFTKVDGGLAQRGAIELSVPVAQSMVADVDVRPDLAVWGTVAPNLDYSNIAREVWVEAGLNPSVPSLSTTMACATSMAAVFDAVGVMESGDKQVAMCGGVESMSNVQIGLTQSLSNWIRRLGQISGVEDVVERLGDLSFGEVGLYIPNIENRATGKTMGEHCEEMAKEWEIPRHEQDRIAYESHENAVEAREAGFFEDLVLSVDGVSRDAFPRPDTSIEKLEKLSPAFDKENGTLTPGNSSPLTDGAAAVWLSTEKGLDRFDNHRPRVRLVDWEVASIDLFTEGLLMAPAYAIPRLLERHELRYEDVDLWEIHEAFAAQIACHLRALESDEFRRHEAGVEGDFGELPIERVNPNGGSVALGHPFGATGARILSQAAKELADMESGSRCIVSICADGGLGAVALLEAA